MTIETILQPLSQLVGIWKTEVTHPALPGVAASGRSDIEWLAGERFLIHRSRTDHTDFPDSISVIGITQHDRVDQRSNTAPTDAAESRLSMHYFDSRGVFRIYNVSIDDSGWRIWRDAPGFSQRFTGKFSNSGDTIGGRWELCRDEVNWKADLQITYRRDR